MAAWQPLAACKHERYPDHGAHHCPHPEQGYRACLSLLALVRQYSAERLKAACMRAMAIRADHLRSVTNILKCVAQLARLDLLVIDDFAISPIGAAERNDLLELLDDRIGTRSTLITSQLPVKAWHTYLNDPTLADAILDRVVHSSHKIELKATKSLRDTAEAASS